MSEKDPLDVDPADYDENMLQSMGLPETGKPSESMPQVFDRLVDAVDDYQREGGGSEPEEFSFAPITVENESPDANVAVKVSENQIAGLRIEESWLVGTPITEVEAAITKVINEALHRGQEQAYEQLQRLATPTGELMSNLREIQADMHRAYMKDLQRVTAPLRDL